MIFIFLASLGFMALEKSQSWTVSDAWYFSVVTLSTVGYGVLTPSNDTTRFFVIVYLMFGAVYFVFVISLLTEYLLQKMMEAMQTHLREKDDEATKPPFPRNPSHTKDRE